MLLLTSTSDIIRVTTGSTGDIRVHASWVDNASGTITPGRTNTASIATATTTTVVAAPAGSTQRNVKNLSIANNHASTSMSVIVEHFDGTTAEQLMTVTLLAGEKIAFDQEGQWNYYDATGSVKPPTPKLDAKLRVVSDVVMATAATFADVTGLTVALKSGRTYNFESHLYHVGNATTTGAQFGYNIGAAPTVARIQAIDVILGSVTAATMGSSASDVTARDTAAMAETTGSAAGMVMCILSGYIQPSADGTFAIRATSEVSVAAGLTIKAGSWLRIWETDS